jgi:hypothetical protein
MFFLRCSLAHRKEEETEEENKEKNTSGFEEH